MKHGYRRVQRGFRSRVSPAILLMILVGFFCGSTIGATVDWNVFTTADMSHWDNGFWTIEYRYACIGFSLDGNPRLSEMFGSPARWGSYWVYASYGDPLAALSDYQQNTLAADYAFTSSELVSGENLNYMYDAEGKVYLAFINYETHGVEGLRYRYGWVELQNNTILSSAYSDMPLIVGTGQVIPEPSSAMLLLLGISGLSLRRRRFTGICRRT